MKDKSLVKAYIALAIVSIVWGTTYFALRIGVATFPAFLFSGIRQFLAGLLLLIGLKISGHYKISTTQWKQQTIPGILMIALGNGVIGWAEKYIPSGLAALIVSILPVYVVVLNFLMGTDKKRPNILILGGLVLGCLGIFLMFKDNIKDITQPAYFAGMLACFGACLAWAYGSIYAKKVQHKNDVLSNAALQMFIGGIAMLIMSPFFDQYQALQTITSSSIWALVYLIVFGSIIAYSAFVYALSRLPVGVASLYAYINPFIALILGYLFLEEKITVITFAALIAALTGVFLINKGYKVNATK